MSKKRDSDGHGFAALRVVGALLPPEFLQTIASLDAKKQSSADYGVSKSLVLKDELARYWRIANDLYSAYAERGARSDADATRVGIQEWLVPLFRDILGYSDIAGAPVTIVGERHFPITHRALGLAVPILLTVRSVELDRTDPRFGDDGKRRAAHGLMQDTLNADDRSLWGIVSNGTTLRVLRDNPSLTRPAYIEADLARIFEEQLYSDFAALWLTLHASRLQPVDGKPSGCVLETWRAQAHETGLRALEHLRDGVTRALRALGNGFLRHPQNEPLRNALADGSLPTDAYFQELLRLVYRILFLFAAEERNLLHDPVASEEQRALYRTGYGLGRLRERALRRRHYDRHADLWQGMCILFRALGAGAAPLGMPALGGLFTADHCANLDGALIANDALLESIHALAFFRNGPSLARVNYRDMGTEELGSVYESLLELQPYLSVDTAPWTFGFVGEENGEKTKGSARKLTGSYYTPAPLVNELILSTLEPVMTQAVTRRSSDPRSALLDLRVVDPACGSGHFLLAAARRIAAEIAKIEAGSDTPDEAARQHALREVVQHCIYGVDRNPLAVELCKTALWIETVEPGKPLTFLDPHIQCGDSLIGVLDPSTMADGIVNDAYKKLCGDDTAVCRDLKRRNRQSGDSVQGSLFDQNSLRTLAHTSAELEAMPEDTLEEIIRKRVAWESARHAHNRQREELRANLFVGTFFVPKRREIFEYIPVTEDLNRLDRSMTMRAGIEKTVSDIAQRHRFFHWQIAFPEIMQGGGFDVVIGNPPWEVSQLSEEEYFAVRAPSIAKLSGAKRKRAVLALAEEEPALWQSFQDALRTTESANLYARCSGRFPLTVRGKVNTYALFAEAFLSLLSNGGRAGLIVPTGIATEDTNKQFFSHVMSSGQLVSLFSFYEVRQVFRDTDSRHPFCLLTLANSPSSESALAPQFCFGLRSIAERHTRERTFTLSGDDLRLLNPNTLTCPIFRSKADADLARKIYARVPVVVNEIEANHTDRWDIDFQQGLFNMTADSHLFRTCPEFGSGGVCGEGTNTISIDGESWLPLYEAKMLYVYDHRYGSFQGITVRTNAIELTRATAEQYADADYLPLPWYWVPERAVQTALRDWPRAWVIAFRDLAKASNERTVTISVLPAVGVGHTASLVFTRRATASAVLTACLVANLNSIVFDYCARQKVSGAHVSFPFVKQLPVLPPSAYLPEDVLYVLPRVAELCATSWDVMAFCNDIWRDANQRQRDVLEQQWENNRELTGAHQLSRPPWYEAGSEAFPHGPFRFNAGRRAVLRAELDAYYSRQYGLTREELRYILDPTDVRGEDYPSETFRVLKERELREYGEYRTARLVLEAWDALDVASRQHSGNTLSISV